MSATRSISASSRPASSSVTAGTEAQTSPNAAPGFGAPTWMTGRPGWWNPSIKMQSGAAPQAARAAAGRQPRESVGLGHRHGDPERRFLGARDDGDEGARVMEPRAVAVRTVDREAMGGVLHRHGLDPPSAEAAEDTAKHGRLAAPGLADDTDDGRRQRRAGDDQAVAILCVIEQQHRNARRRG